jgi:hypothetical protein
MHEERRIWFVLQEHDQALFILDLVELGELAGSVGLGTAPAGPALGYGQASVVIGIVVAGTAAAGTA